VLPNRSFSSSPSSILVKSSQEGRWADWNFTTCNATLSKMPTVGNRGSRQNGWERAAALLPSAEGFSWEWRKTQRARGKILGGGSEDGREKEYASCCFNHNWKKNIGSGGAGSMSCFIHTCCWWLTPIIRDTLQWHASVTGTHHRQVVYWRGGQHIRDMFLL